MCRGAHQTYGAIAERDLWHRAITDHADERAATPSSRTKRTRHHRHADERATRDRGACPRRP